MRNFATRLRSTRSDTSTKFINPCSSAGGLAPPKPNAVELDFTAAPVDGAGDPIRFELHLSQDRASDREEVLGLVDDTVTAILDGRLPPGTRELV